VAWPSPRAAGYQDFSARASPRSGRPRLAPPSTCADAPAGYVRNVRLYNIHCKNPDGDGIFLNGAGKYTEGADVPDISIIHCRLTGHGRNGLSVQKCMQKIRIFERYTEGNDKCGHRPRAHRLFRPRRAPRVQDHVLYAGR
jgi:hypothetical protein